MEWKSGVRCDGLTGAISGAAAMLCVGIGQALYNLGLMRTGYMQPEQIGVSEAGIPLYADQPASAVNWINMSYQGTYILMGILIFIVFFFVYKIENELPRVEKELQERKVAECAALGIEYIPADVKERMEIEAQEKEAEEIRIRELKEKCEKQGLDFEAENKKVLDARAAKEAKAAARAAAKAAKAKRG